MSESYCWTGSRTKPFSRRYPPSGQRGRTHHMISRMKRWIYFMEFSMAKNMESRRMKLVTLFASLVILSAFISLIGQLSRRVKHRTGRDARTQVVSPAFLGSCSAWKRFLPSSRTMDAASSRTQKVPDRDPSFPSKQLSAAVVVTKSVHLAWSNQYVRKNLWYLAYSTWYF